MKFLRKHLPRREALENQRWLRPLAPWLGRAQLWHFNRRSVARGVAVGLFFGLLIPVAQIVCAAVAAIGLRANVPVAALATLVTNPFTFPPIYYGAFRIGQWILGNETGAPAAFAGDAAGTTVIARLTEWLSTVGPALALGLSILAVVAAALGYFGVHAGWRLAISLRRRRSG